MFCPDRCALISCCVILQNERSPAQFEVRAHAQIMDGFHPSQAHLSGNWIVHMRGN